MSKYKTHKRTAEGKAQTVSYKAQRRAKLILSRIEDRALIERMGHQH